MLFVLAVFDGGRVSAFTRNEAGWQCDNACQQRVHSSMVSTSIIYLYTVVLLFTRCFLLFCRVVFPFIIIFPMIFIRGTSIYIICICVCAMMIMIMIIMVMMMMCFVM